MSIANIPTVAKTSVALPVNVSKPEPACIRSSYELIKPIFTIHLLLPLSTRREHGNSFPPPVPRRAIQGRDGARWMAWKTPSALSFDLTAKRATISAHHQPR